MVSVKNVSFAYRKELVLDSINLEVQQGDFLGIIGPNGSGKTTLLKIILGLLKPTTGSVSLFGIDIQSFSQWDKIGYVAQKPSLSTYRIPITVEEVVQMANKQNVRESLQAVSMDQHRQELLRELSGGQQQRVFIARALANNPKLLVLDEPTTGVDTESQTEFWKLLRMINTELGVTLILVSHDIDVVAHEVSQIACVNTRLICHGKPTDVLTSTSMEQLYGKDVRFVVHGH